MSRVFDNHNNNATSTTNKNTHNKRRLRAKIINCHISFLCFNKIIKMCQFRPLYTVTTIYSLTYKVIELNVYVHFEQKSKEDIVRVHRQCFRGIVFFFAYIILSSLVLGSCVGLYSGAATHANMDRNMILQYIMVVIFLKNAERSGKIFVLEKS